MCLHKNILDPYCPNYISFLYYQSQIEDGLLRDLGSNFLQVIISTKSNTMSNAKPNPIYSIPTAQVDSFVEDYLASVLDQVSRRPSDELTRTVSDPVKAVFDLLTARRYGHLGRKKSEPYRRAVEDHLTRDIDKNRPLQFYFDLGPGYHASLAPEKGSLVFDVGLGELLALRQVISFCNEVRLHYELGAQFHIVIDNLCGWATNDIPLERSLGYVQQLRDLIDEMGAGDLVSLLVESENSSVEEYAEFLSGLPKKPPIAQISPDQIENVSRFLGRPCSKTEAIWRIERYGRTSITTEALLEGAIRGVRLTQRASASTLGFRPFTGGDQRIQVGQVVLSCSTGGGIKPILLSSRNVHNYNVLDLMRPDSLPETIGTVCYAQPS
jgi:hypothetical protein